jgi:endoglucanase
VLGRGINFGGVLDGDADGASWLRERHFDVVREAGLDTVRVPVKWSARSEPRPPCSDFATDFGAFDVGRNAWRAPLRQALLGHRDG